MSAAAPCRLLEWDTAFFGVPVARVAGDRLSPGRADEALAWCEAHGVARLEFLAAVDDPATVAAVESRGFQFVDIRMELSSTVPAGGLELPDMTRPSTEHDLPALEDAAARNHHDSRYYADPAIPRERADALFRTWIRNSCRGYADAVVTADAGDGAKGYVTLHHEPAEAPVRIGLLGVHGEARGRGHGRRLIAAAAVEARRRGARRLAVVTQGRNVAALRLYEHAGFRADSVGLWYHRWFAGGRS